jgi:glyoxylase-like metal-dependent hydrolase (beta-lactamase superfamily II)
MQIHAMKTGVMTVKNCYCNAKGRWRILRFTSSLLDSGFRDVPVYTWAIEHPEGVIVIDTGLTAQMNSPNYFPLLQRPYWRTQYRYKITPEEEIGPQLRLRGISPQEVRWVVITHAHFDHTSALYHFPNSEIIFFRKEYQDVQRFRSAHFDFPSKWPDWLKIRLIDYIPEPVGSFKQSYPLTQVGDVRLVPTPGHTMGHQSVVLQDVGQTYFFAADASFDLPSLLNGTLDAPAFNSDVTLKTRDRICDFAASQSLVYLSTHDPETERLLTQHIPVQPSAQKAGSQLTAMQGDIR